MKKIILATVLIGAFAVSASPAFAYTMVNGQKVMGYVRGVKPVDLQEHWTPTPTPEASSTVTGNTRVYDILKILPTMQDQMSLLRMIDSTGLKF